jgi:hypothetical protein
MVLLEAYRYRLPVRRFIIDLFEKSVLRNMVLEEEEEDFSDDTPNESDTLDSATTSRSATQ